MNELGKLRPLFLRQIILNAATGASSSYWRTNDGRIERKKFTSVPKIGVHDLVGLQKGGCEAVIRHADISFLDYNRKLLIRELRDRIPEALIGMVTSILQNR